MADTERAECMSRVQMNLPPRSIERLDDLVARTESASYAEVMRNALRLYDATVVEVEAGRSVYVLRGDECVPILVLAGA